MTLRIAVLGCGPTGLAAVHAINIATNGTAQVHIFSQNRKSQLYGAQYLHQPIFGLGGANSWQPIRYSLQGTVSQYQAKVYGDQYMPEMMSPESFTNKDAVAWDIRDTYDRLWVLYGGSVTDCRIDPQGLANLIKADKHPYNLIVNTIPLDALCKVGHTFASQEIWAVGSTGPLKRFDDLTRVICNGLPNPSWYRQSRIFGYETTEWPGYISKPPVYGITRWNKPLRHNCDCWPWAATRMVCVGRYGAWRKGYLVHHAYEMVNRIVKVLLWNQPVIGDPNTWNLAP